MIPDGWDKVLLHQVAEVRTGLSKSANRNGPTVKRPYLRVANVQDGYLDLDDVQEIDVPASQVERFTLKTGDLLLIEGNGNPQNLGRGCLWHGQVTNCVHQNHVFAVRIFRESALTQEFLAIQLQSERGRNYLLSCAKGSTGLSTLNSKQLQQMPLLLPSQVQQTAIADLLSTWDAAIEKTERLIAAKEKRFRGLVNRLVVAPARTNINWKHLQISDIADRVQRRSNGDEYPILTISSASGFVLQKEKYSRYMAGESVKNYILLRRGEFAYNKGNSLRYQFGCIFELKAYEESLVPHVYVCFRLREGVVPSYLGHLFEVDYLKPQLGAIVKTGVRNNGLLNIRPEEFMNVVVPIPPFNQQKQIAATLNTARQEIDLLIKQAEAYRRQKRGLMQKLLTGEWRVKMKGVVG